MSNFNLILGMDSTKHSQFRHVLQSLFSFLARFIAGALNHGSNWPIASHFRYDLACLISMTVRFYLLALNLGAISHFYSQSRRDLYLNISNTVCFYRLALNDGTFSIKNSQSWRVFYVNLPYLIDFKWHIGIARMMKLDVHLRTGFLHRDAQTDSAVFFSAILSVLTC